MGRAGGGAGGRPGGVVVVVVVLVVVLVVVVGPGVEVLKEMVARAKRSGLLLKPWASSMTQAPGAAVQSTGVLPLAGASRASTRYCRAIVPSGSATPRTSWSK